jgi:hypothetical protein
MVETVAAGLVIAFAGYCVVVFVDVSVLLFTLMSVASDQRVGEEGVGVQRAIVFQSDTKRDSLGQQDLRGNTLGVPGIPAARQPLLDGVLLRRPRNISRRNYQRTDQPDRRQ